MTVDDTEPLFTVLRGAPTVQQLAALVALLTARQAAPASETPVATRAAAVSRWAGPVLRMPLPHGPGAWRASGLNPSS